MEIFIASPRNEKASSKVAVFSGFHPKCKYAEKKLLEDPEPKASGQYKSTPLFSTLFLVLLMLTDRCVLNSANLGHQERFPQRSHNIGNWDSPPRAHKCGHLGAALPELRGGVHFHTQSPRYPHLWQGEQKVAMMAWQLWIVGEWSLGNKYALNLLENVENIYLN